MRRTWGEVAVLVRARAVERHVSGRVLATLLEVDHGHVSRMLNGKATPSWEVFVRLCEVLDLSADDLLDQRVIDRRVTAAFSECMTVDVARLDACTIVIRFHGPLP